MKTATLHEHDEELERERSELVTRIEHWLDWPLALLGFVWLLLLIVELVQGVSPFLLRVGQIIWIIFIAEFVFRFSLAPSKAAYLRRNWLTIIALVVPALRALRFIRALRALRGVRVVRIVTSLNRGMRALGRSMQRRGLPYVLALTIAMLVTGAAGMYAFENLAGDQGLNSYVEALWWTAMLLTTIGSEYWPQTPEGRALTLLLSLYALGILGYLAGSLASFFIGRDAEAPEAEVAGETAVQRLAEQIAALRAELEGRE